MALIEEYYELNEAEEISVMWKLTQILFYVSAACFGLWCGYTMALIRAKLENKCFLFAVVKLPKSVEKIESENVIWQNDYWCNYTQYTMVCSFIVATIWGTFYLMCGKGGKSQTGLPQPWRIVLPSLIFSLIYFIIAASAAFNIQQGVDYFCLRHDFQEKMETKSLIDSCKTLKYFFENDLYVTALQFEIIEITSWACVLSWLILFFISFFRIVCVADFDMYKICVFKVGDSNKKEEVLRITNYEEPAKINPKYRKKPVHIDLIEKAEERREKRRVRERMYYQTPRAFYNLENRPAMQPKQPYFVTGDIRMLNKEKKKKNISRSLDEAFERNALYEMRKIQTSLQVQAKMIDEREKIRLLQHLYNYDADAEEEFNEEQEGESSTSSIYKEKKANFRKSGNESDFKSNPSIQFKKRL